LSRSKLYLVIAFGSVTHRDIFLEHPIKLPVLNVDLPLVGFFVVTPVVLAIFHFFIFLQLFALAAKSNDYGALLRQEAPVASDRQYLRQRLDSFLVLQFLAGPKEQRTGFGGISLRLITWLTLVCAPLLILLQAQMTFLPYHLGWVVWLQRFVVFLDLVVIGYFWTRVRSDDDPTIRSMTNRCWRIISAVAGLCVVVFSLSVATFPGEWTNENLPSFRRIPAVWWPGWYDQSHWTSLHELLFEGTPDEVSGRPRSLFSNQLILTDQSFVDQDKLDKIDVNLSLRGRNLRQAVFNRSDLRKSDFTGAILDRASFTSTKLQNSTFWCASKDKHELGCTSLKGSDLSFANLQGANMTFASMQGANLTGAYLKNARLRELNFRAPISILQSSRVRT
jgi:Pentapeptide repeats (8 copies)